MESIYDRDAVRPMWEELAAVGVAPVTTAEEVDSLLSQKEGTVMVVVNSVCGCAAGGARPGVAIALQNKIIPDKSITVFAGVDRPAVNAARAHMTEVPPSSPSVGLFKDGQLVFALQRQHIEGMDPRSIAQALAEGFDEFCTAPGPSIPREQFDQLAFAQVCASSIPLTGHK